MSKEVSFDIKEQPLFQVRNLIWDNTRDEKRYVIGRILTIIDASISDQEQRKGIKDLIHQVSWGQEWREKELSEILLQFSEKYCPDIMPTTNDLQDAFLGDGKPINPDSKIDYFAKFN